MSLWNGYLWPVWYFIGIGIIFKLIKNTKVITKSIKEALPSSLYLPSVVVLLIVSGSALMWRNDLGQLVSALRISGRYYWAILSRHKVVLE
jgi:hypothetical protein